MAGANSDVVNLEIMFDFMKNEASKANERHEEIKAIQMKQLVQDAKIKTLEDDNVVLKQQVKHLMVAVTSIQQLAMAKNVVLRNVPEIEKNSEDLADICQNLFNYLGMNQDVECKAIYRLGKRKEKSSQRRPILVKFVNKEDKSQLLKEKREKPVSCANISLNGNAIGKDGDTIFINTQLAPQTAKLYYMVRQLRKMDKFEYGWVDDDGNIFVRQAEGQPAVRIVHEDQLEVYTKESTAADVDGRIKESTLKQFFDRLNSSTAKDTTVAKASTTNKVNKPDTAPTERRQLRRNQQPQ